MAYIEKRANKDGTTTHLVRWRPGKDPAAKMAYEPFDGPDADLRAEKFKIEVKLAGEQWPPLYAPRVGYLTPAQWAAMFPPDTPPPPDPAPGTPLVSYAAAYVDRLTGIQANTRSGYHRLLANYVHAYEPLAGADVRDVGEDEIADWINWLERGEADEAGTGWIRAPKSPKTIANAHGLLYSIFAKSCRGENPLRRTNPCADTRLPRLDDGTGEEMVFLTAEEFGILWRAADARARDVLAIAVGTGARFGEYTAFQCGDVDLRGVVYGPDGAPAGLNGAPPRVHVERAWKRLSQAVPTLGPPKSKAGNRWVTVDLVTAGVIAPLLEGRAPGDYLLTDARGHALRHGTWYAPLWQPTVYRAVRCEAHRAADRAEGREIDGETVRLTSRRQLTMRWIVPCGCPGTLRKVPRVHDLRHTAVAWLIAANYPLWAIAKWLGHESVATIEKTYAHLLPELDLRQFEAMGTVLAPLNITPSTAALRLAA
jgi:integrase